MTKQPGPEDVIHFVPGIFPACPVEKSFWGTSTPQNVTCPDCKATDEWKEAAAAAGVTA